MTVLRSESTVLRQTTAITPPLALRMTSIGLVHDRHVSRTVASDRRTRAKCPGVFLDRDGVIIENREDYVKSWPEVRFLDGAPDPAAVGPVAAGDRDCLEPGRRGPGTPQSTLSAGCTSGSSPRFKRAAAESTPATSVRTIRTRGAIAASRCRGCWCGRPGNSTSNWAIAGWSAMP